METKTEYAPEFITCKRCQKSFDALEAFPGQICLACYESKEGKEPLTSSDFEGMMKTFKGKRR